jgi:hypothetical protein
MGNGTFRQLDRTCGATAVHRARTLSGQVRLAVASDPYLAFLATMPLTGVAGDACRAARTRMCLKRAHRYRPLPGLPARDDGRHRLAARCQGDHGADRSIAPGRRGPGRRAAPPLSYTLDDPPGSPSVYVTWEPHRTGDGTIIHLNVDEPAPLAGSTEDLENAWLPVLSGLVKHLERGPASPAERTT